VNDVYADAVVTVILKTESGDCPGNTGRLFDEIEQLNFMLII
jgi:hypothetical protein